MYYLNSRYYNPEIGRFINADIQLTAGSDMTGINLFAYCGNNPINRTDVTGCKWYHWVIGGAVLGGGSAYVSTRGSTSAQTIVKPKVTSTIKNEVIDLPRTGRALKTDPYHAFPNIVDNYAGYATKSPINNGTLYQLQGSLNGTAGRFEWIVQNQQVTHRMFVKGGTINGIQIMP